MRARVIRLHHLTAKKLIRLRREAETDGAYRVARRIHSVLLNNDEYTSGGIASHRYCKCLVHVSPNG